MGNTNNFTMLLGNEKDQSWGTGNGSCQRKTLSWLPGRDKTPKFYSDSLPKGGKLKDGKLEKSWGLQLPII